MLCAPPHHHSNRFGVALQRLVAYFVTHLAFRFLVVTIAWAWALFGELRLCGAARSSL